MKKLYYLGAFTTLAGTMALCSSLFHHIQNAAASSSDLLITACILCLGSVIMSVNKTPKIQ